jgi:broad specificity phosphatase PhoE
MSRIFLVRHGQASFTAADYDQLSEVGMTQSRLLGAWFEQCGWPVHHVVVGGMKRHLQTAESFFSGYPAAPDWHAHLHRSEQLNEVNHHELFTRWMTAEHPEALAKGAKFGDMTPAEFETKWPTAILRWLGDLHPEEYAEPWSVFSRRCMSAFDQAAALAGKGENVLVVTSGGVISAICRNILGISAEQMVRLMWEITNGSVTSFARKGGHYSMTSFNVTSHLDRAGKPELITLK